MSKMAEIDMINKDMKRLGYNTLDLLQVVALRLNAKPDTTLDQLFALARKDSK
jgi:hypothetical protein